nr:aquaporin-like [Vanessa tameamea]
MAVSSRTDCVGKIKVVEELKSRPALEISWCSWWCRNWRAILGELVATTLLIFLCCMTCIPIDGVPLITPMYSPIGSGLIVLFIAQSFGHISGAFMNPSVTLLAVIWGKISLPLGIAYAIAECLGATIGYGMLMVLSPSDLIAGGICTTQPHAGHTVYQALGVEVVFTAALGFVICSVWDPVNEEKNECTSIKFGLSVSGLAIAGGPLAGASMNPARSLGPAIWTARWSSHWIYWVGPLFGGAVTVTLYKLVWLKREPITQPRLFAWNDDIEA